MEQVEIEVVGAQPAQRALDVRADVLLVDVAAARDLGGDHHLVAPRAVLLQPVADDRLGRALGTRAVRGDRVLPAVQGAARTEEGAMGKGLAGEWSGAT